MKDTKQQFEHVIAVCRDLFSKKLHDYGPAWRILRPSSVTDQIFIKANRIRSIETKGVTLVDEGIRSEFIAIVNYGIVGLIQLELGYAEAADMTNEEALVLYDKYAKTSLELMLAKNHDYDEAWRSMRISSYTDLILMKIYRTKLMKSHYQPWRENEKILWKKRIGYLYYQARALFADQESLAKAYDALATALPENGYVCEQSAMTKPDAYEKAWCQALTDVTFEGETFKAPAEYDKFLTTLYGDYMQLPPEDQRENRHQIVQIDFGA